MLKKVISIQNIGKFDDFKTAGNVDFKDLTLLYGDNGLGKTTLASIFRSLSTNDDIYIVPRKTVNNPDSKAGVELLLDKTYKYQEGKGWDGSFSDIEIFDDKFVNENVYSGETVAHEHKKNLYYFVVGDAGVQLAQEVESLVNNIKNKVDEIKDKGSEIEEQIAWRGEIKEFVYLSNIKNINTKISETKKKIEILKRQGVIQSIPIFSKADLEELELDKYFETLIKELEDMSLDVESKITYHIDNCLDNNGEIWLESGYKYFDGVTCPFCGQSVLQSEGLIKTYREYFSKAYADFKREIHTERIEIDEYFSQRKVLQIQRNFEENEAVFDRWKEYIGELKKFEWKFDIFMEKWDSYQNFFTELFNKKIGQPLENLVTDTERKRICALSSEIHQTIINFNKWVDGANNDVEVFRRMVGKGDLKSIEEELVRLDAVRQRYLPSVDKLCEEFKILETNQTNLETEKTDKKNKLDAYVKIVLPENAKKVNKHLEKFGVDFSLSEMKVSYSGQNPSAVYGLKLNGVDIKVSTSKNEPCFKDSLSAGDKSALALAFFLAKINSDPQLSNKIVIFDDPMTSLDSGRRNNTREEIMRVFKKAKQVIVFSHDMYFLKNIWEFSDKRKISTLKIDMDNGQSVIKNWDIFKDTQRKYFKHHKKLRDFIETDEGDAIEIKMCIRLVLENYLYVKFPNKLRGDEMLGAGISILKSDSAFQGMSDFLDEITDLNNYSKKDHHADIAGGNQSINKPELKTYVERTINLIAS